DGQRLHVIDKGSKSGGPALASYKATCGVPGSKFVSFRLDVFEEAILGQLREIKARDILPTDDHEADRVQVLTGKLAGIESRLEALKAQLLDGGDVPAIVEVVRTLDAKRAEAAAELEEAKQKAATPLSESWGECKSLLDVVQNAPDPEVTR